MAAIPLATTETCSYCGSKGGEYHFCTRPRDRKPLLVVLKKVECTSEKRKRNMIALYVAGLMALMSVAQVATDPAAPWNLIAPGTSAAAIIVFAWLMSRSKEKSDALFAQTMRENSKEMTDAMREVRESIRELSGKIGHSNKE